MLYMIGYRPLIDLRLETGEPYYIHGPEKVNGEVLPGGRAYTSLAQAKKVLTKEQTFRSLQDHYAVYRMLGSPDDLEPYEHGPYVRPLPALVVKRPLRVTEKVWEPSKRGGKKRK